MATTDEPSYPIASVDNALRLILMFRDEGALRLSTAAAELGIANSTAHRLLAMLRHHGFVRQNPATKAYEAGPALVEVGLSVVGRMDIRAQARPWLEELAQRSGETVHLAVREGTVVRYLDAIESNRAVRVVSRVGKTVPAHCCSVGKALLSVLPKDELRRLYDGVTLTAATKRSITRMTVLERELAKVRQRGYAINIEESEDGMSAIAAPVEIHSTGQVVAISIAAPHNRMQTDQIRHFATMVCEAAEGLAEALNG